MGLARKTKEIIAERIADLLVDEKQLQARLGPFERFSQVAVVCGIAVPILAGSTILTASGGVTVIGHWPLISGVLTLVASVLVALHKGLNCKSFHARCHLALAELRSLVQAYERLTNGVLAGGPDETFEALEARLEAFDRTYISVLPLRATRVVSDA